MQNKKIRLQAISREDLPALARFNNDLDVELAGGDDPPWPQVWSNGRYNDLVHMGILRTEWAHPQA